VDELKLLTLIERTIRLKIPKVIVPGFEVDPNAKAEPIRKPVIRKPQRKPDAARGPRRDKPMVKRDR
jgi:ATP-dependent RNA helicase RhlE